MNIFHLERRPGEVFILLLPDFIRTCRNNYPTGQFQQQSPSIRSSDSTQEVLKGAKSRSKTSHAGSASAPTNSRTSRMTTQRPDGLDTCAPSRMGRRHGHRLTLQVRRMQDTRVHSGMLTHPPPGEVLGDVPGRKSICTTSAVLRLQKKEVPMDRSDRKA
jgi:hypothetical protein